MAGKGRVRSYQHVLGLRRYILPRLCTSYYVPRHFLMWGIRLRLNSNQIHINPGSPRYLLGTQGTVPRLLNELFLMPRYNNQQHSNTLLSNANSLNFVPLPPTTGNDDDEGAYQTMSPSPTPNHPEQGFCDDHEEHFDISILIIKK